MSSRHPDVLPEDCKRCGQLHAERVRDHQEHPTVRVTLVQLGQRIGLTDERTVRLHLAHLVVHGRLLADRRTPAPGLPVVRGAALPPDADALTWAVNQATADRACARLLAEFGRIGWSGQARMAALARAAGISLRTVERHRPHLVTGERIEVARVYVRGTDGQVTQEADRFRLVAPLVLVPVETPRVAGRADRFDRQARDLMARVLYLGGPDAVDVYLLARVAQCLREGLPKGALWHMVTDDVPDRIESPVRFLVSRLPASGARVLISAQHMVGVGWTPPVAVVRRAPVLPMAGAVVTRARVAPRECRVCRVQFPAGFPVEFDMCGKDHCRDASFGEQVSGFTVGPGAGLAVVGSAPGASLPLPVPVF